jgi:hypothetical protein
VLILPSLVLYGLLNLDVVFNLTHNPIRISLIEAGLLMLALSLKVGLLLLLDNLEPFVLLDHYVLYLSLWVLSHALEEFHLTVTALHFLYGICNLHVVLLLSFLQDVAV